MKKVMLDFVFFFLLFFCSGQQPDTVDLAIPVILQNPVEAHCTIPGNSIYFDLAGHLNLGSLNYERMFFHVRDFYISVRVGAGYIPPVINTISLPILVNGLYQLSNVFLLELGIGVSTTYTFWQDYENPESEFERATFHKAGRFIDPLLTGFAGIRVQKKKGFLFRFGITPLLELTNDIENRTIYKQIETSSPILLWVGMSFGYSFNTKKAVVVHRNENHY